MSRGYGRIQRALLATLKKRGLADTYMLAAEVYDLKRTDDDPVIHLETAQLVAVRRAIAGLVKDGKVFFLERQSNGRVLWGSKAFYKGTQKFVAGGGLAALEAAASVE